MNALQYKINELRNVYNVQFNNDVVSTPDTELYDAIESCMSLLAARERLKRCGCTITKTDGEYRVNVKGGMEATAYYTNDIDDAVSTAERMAIKPHHTSF